MEKNVSERKLSVRYYVLMSLSAIFFALTPYSFYWYAIDPIKDSMQGFLGAGGTIVFFAHSLILYLYAEERQKPIDYGEYIPPDRRKKTPPLYR
jgi:polyferredoxin